MSSIEEMTKLHPDWKKQIEYVMISAKVEQTENGEENNNETWESAKVELGLMAIPENAGAFLLLHYPRQKLRDRLGNLVIYRIQLTGLEQGWSMNLLDFANAEAQHVSVTISERKKITEEEALKLWQSGKCWLRTRKGNGKNLSDYTMPCVETVRIER